MKAVFYNINNCVSTEEFDMDFNPYHINDVINLDTTCIKINQDDYAHKVEENINLTGTFKIVAIKHHATVETIMYTTVGTMVTTHYKYNIIVIMIKPYNP